MSGIRRAGAGARSGDSFRPCGLVAMSMFTDRCPIYGLAGRRGEDPAPRDEDVNTSSVDSRVSKVIVYVVCDVFEHLVSYITQTQGGDLGEGARRLAARQCRAAAAREGVGRHGGGSAQLDREKAVQLDNHVKLLSLN